MTYPSLNDRVAHTPKFVQVMDEDEEIAKKRGTVVALVDDIYVTVKWDNDDIPRGCHVGNLCRVAIDGSLVNYT